MNSKVNVRVAIVLATAAFAAAGGDAAAMPDRVAGFLPWLDRLAVDHSCVSTFIPTLGFALAARGAWRVLRRRPADPAFFPFFRSFDQLVVALGLIGTLWGIILIGCIGFLTDKIFGFLTGILTPRHGGAAQ